MFAVVIMFCFDLEQCISRDRWDVIGYSYFLPLSLSLSPSLYLDNKAADIQKSITLSEWGLEWWCKFNACKDRVWWCCRSSCCSKGNLQRMWCQKRVRHHFFFTPHWRKQWNIRETFFKVCLKSKNSWWIPKGVLLKFIIFSSFFSWCHFLWEKKTILSKVKRERERFFVHFLYNF